MVSHHGFSSKDRKASAPAFGDLRDKALEEDHRLSRTEEIENIPEVVEDDAVPSISPRHSPPKRMLMGVGRQASQRSDISEDLPPPPPSPPILSSPSPPPPPPPFEEDLDELPPPLPEPLVDEVSALQINAVTLNGVQEIPPEDDIAPPPDNLESDYPIPEHVVVEDLPSEQQLEQQQQQQYFPHPPPHQEAEDTAIPYPPPTATTTELPPSGVRNSPLKVLGGGGESSTESSTLIAPTNDSFSREDSLDVTAQEQDVSQGDISVADLSHKVKEDAAARAASEGSILSGHDDDHKRRGRHRPTDTAYYIAKELLMTERTYKKDLEVLCVWFRNAVSCEPAIHTAMHELLFQYLDPIYNFHHTFLKEVEQRLAAWEGKAQPQTNGECQKIGDLMLKAINNLQELYETYFEHLEEILTEVESKIKRQRPFEEICRGFESQKVCYLPLNTFFLRPGQRLLHFKLILERLVKHYSFTHHDTEDCKEALCQVTEIIQGVIDNFRKVENLEKLMELQRDLLGLENLVHLDREFIREGCLQKFSRKGYQQRMFFLFSDMLVYTSRTSASLLQFKVHGQLPLRGMTVEETDQSKSSVQNSFAIYAGNKYILVAASSPEEKDKWIEDINEAVQRVKQLGLDKLQYPSLKSSASSSENVGGSGENVDGDGEKEKEKPIQHRANTTMHVCWHRNTSVSMRDHDKALKNQLSGYLLRKFKTSNGWQKLWVVFTNFCLFFYKTYQDDLPLASLPLLGYAVNTPDEEDGINKDHVFKLQFKNHVYFFRAESEFTFSRSASQFGVEVSFDPAGS
ncbi:FERM, RhoGEF and pleckstrin domain-containing protein [Elysia marginata]|uniref:FERM, RhoGEF and pleckstrin domain-containing protein n=1 Tax=Elysia marginata TaxID=1093978 RepID=A0AAV4FZ49_9GAST|nr:FERM, RhoGEF and pleckstrin domain-containing protein [Elysia marginata]